MEDNCFTLRSDIQQCIATDMNLDARYEHFLFDKGNMLLVHSLGCFENLEIIPDGSLMRFKGEIAKDLDFTEEDMIKIKQELWRKNAAEVMKQIAEKKKTQQQRENEEVIARMKLKEWLDISDQIQSIIKNTSEEKKEKARKYLKSVKSVLDQIDLELDYEEKETMIMLSGNFETLKFSRNELRLLANMAGSTDLFMIAPNYDYEDEDNEDCNGIRIVLSINILEEE